MAYFPHIALAHGVYQSISARQTLRWPLTIAHCRFTPAHAFDMLPAPVCSGSPQTANMPALATLGLFGAEWPWQNGNVLVEHLIRQPNVEQWMEGPPWFVVVHIEHRFSP